MIVYTGGTFDLFHAGHVQFLRRCSELAGPQGRVVVSLNTDGFIERYKGRPPVIAYVDREACLMACRYVDTVIPNVGEEDSKVAIEITGPDLVVIGDDWAKRDYHAQMGFTERWLAERHIRLLYIPYSYSSGLPSSAIRERIE